jgi:glycosyltransferase involved in cell wall biosynthesis
LFFLRIVKDSVVNILVLEPYFGGSHKYYVESLQNHSRHDIQVFQLPARYWKWRLSGAPFQFSDQFRKLTAPPDLILCANTIDMAAFTALAGPLAAQTPKIIFFHENQVTYPLSKDDTPDAHFSLINITSAMVCDEVWFNSDYHRQSFLMGLDGFLNQFPDFVPDGLAAAINAKSRVEFLPVDPLPEVEPRPQTKALRILWNHRWEYDKDPERFFAALERLLLEGVDFEVALLGENFRRKPPIFERMQKHLGARIVVYGYVENRREYSSWVKSCDVVASCARQEYFGISVAEAVLAGCYPILPQDQVYPEFIPPERHGRHLYADDSQFVSMLRDAARNIESFRQQERLPYYDRFVADRMVARYDDEFERVAAAHRRG